MSKNASLISWKMLLLISIIAGAINSIPLFLVTLAGDAVMNYAQVVCYSKQLGQGILYPRWCMDANWGLGSPAPIFYFPFAFYVAALFSPLTHLGVPLQQQYIFTIGLANIVTFFTCALWLQRIVGWRIALICAFIFIFSSYRVEISNARQSFAELWAIAFLPLLFKYVHEMAYEHKKVWPQLSVVLIPCLLSHPPATLIGLMGAGLHLLWCSQNRIKNIVQLGVATALATAFTLFQNLPIKLLASTLSADVGGVDYWKKSWINSFVDSAAIFVHHQRFLIALAISLFVVFLIALKFWRNKEKLPDGLVRHEAMGWVLVMAFAFIMMFSISAPLWWLVEIVSEVKTPWRMTSLIMLGMVFVLAVSLRWVWKIKPNTQTGDHFILAFFFVLFSLFYSGGVQDDSLEIFKEVVAGQPVIHYFSTKDLDKKYGDVDFFYETFANIPNRKQVAFTKGGGKAVVAQWNERGIHVDVTAHQPSTLRLEHFYFPIWKASLAGKDVVIRPEAEKGRMLIDVPAGKHALKLHMDYFSMLPRAFHFVWLAMVLSALVIGLGYRKNKVV